MLQVLRGKHFETNKNIELEIRDGKIVKLTPVDDADNVSTYIAPGLIDGQINGYDGVDFNTFPLAEDELQAVCNRLAKKGITSFFPTVITNRIETIGKMLQVIVQARKNNPLVESMIPGIHLEGPFLSPHDGARGAHAKEFITAPNWEQFAYLQEQAEGLIRILTLSPEWEESNDFIRACVESGVIVSIGHTLASPEQIQMAVEAGASLSTHLGNGAPAMLPRHPNFIWEQLANDGLTASVIADGYHLPKSVLKTFLRTKEDLIFIVSDAVFLSGKAPGRYSTHIGGEVILSEDGRLCTAEDTRLLAGSVKILPEEISFLLRENLVCLSRAWNLASQKPAEFLGLESKGKLEVGYDADLVLFSLDGTDIQVEEVYKSGNKV